MNCKTAQRMISDGVNLHSNEALRNHLSICVDCTKYRAQIEKIDDMTAQINQYDVPVGYWETVWPRVRQKLKNLENSGRVEALPRLRLFPKRILVLVAAVLLISIGLNVYLLFMKAVETYVDKNFKGDNNDLADKILKVLKNQEFFKKISNKAFEDVSEYTWNIRAKKIKSFIF